MKLYKLLPLIIIVASSINVYSQVAINTTGVAPVASSMLDITSTTSGLLIPRMTLAQKTAIAAPATGLLVYQTDGQAGFWYYDGAAWIRFFGGNAWDILGNTGTLPATNFLGTIDAQDLQIKTNNTNRMRIMNSTYPTVGIGTTTPVTNMDGNASVLHVHDGGNLIPSQLILSTHSTAAGIKTGNLIFAATQVTNDRRTGSIESYLTAYAAPNASGDLRFFTNNINSYTEKMRIMPNGYIGIGNTAPGYNLDITGNTRTTGKYFGHLNVDDTRAVNDPPTAFNNEVAFEFKSRATVGVGGSGTYSGQITIAPWGDNSGDASHQLNFNEGGLFWRQGQPDAATWDPWVQILTTANAPTGSGILNYIPKWTPNGTTLGNSQLFDNGTNVGLGTITPSQKLHILGNSLTSGDIYVNTATTGSIHWGTSGIFGAAPSFVPNSGNPGLWIEGSNDGESGGLFLNGNTMCLWSPGDNDIFKVFDEDNFGGGYKMVITGSGYLGVGTALVPSELIHTSGNIRADGIAYWGNGLVRTETRDNAGLRGDVGARSGFFETASPTNYPAGASSWWHLIDSRHSNNANNYALQIAGSFFDQRLYFRKTNDNPAQAWSEILTTASGVVTSSCGTANYVPKMTSASNIGCSLIYDNGTNIGIGTITPTSKLHVTADGDNVPVIYGININNTAGTTSYGVRGECGSIGLGSAGVSGVSTNSSQNEIGILGDYSLWGASVFGLAWASAYTDMPTTRDYGVFATVHFGTASGVYSDGSGSAYSFYGIGNFGVTGAKSASVPTTKGNQLLYCTESPELWFEDIGSGKLVNGVATINLDELFLETVQIDSEHPIQVFIQENGDCNGVFVLKETDKFIVKEKNNGQSNIEFSYRVLAKRKYYQDHRFGVDMNQPFGDNSKNGKYVPPITTDPNIMKTYVENETLKKEMEYKNKKQ